jgi:hypothetical protein
MRDIRGELNAELSWQQKQSTRRRIFLAANYIKFKEKIRKMPDLELGFVRCFNLDTWGSGSEIPGKF